MSRILLIEPDVILGRTYSTALQQAGHKVTVHQQAQPGIFAVEKKQPDLIVLELQLPGHGGFEFMHELRSYAEWQNIPVLLHTFVSPKRLHYLLGRLQSMGIAGYLYKPAASLQQMVSAANKAIKAA